MKHLEELQQQEEYETRVLVFRTAFKGSYVSDFENGFSNQKFIGTRKEYDEATAIYYKDESKGKIIGTYSYTLEEWEEMCKPKEEDKVEKEKRMERIKKLEALFDKELEFKRAMKRKVLKTKRS